MGLRMPLYKIGGETQTKSYIELPYAAMSPIQLNAFTLSDPHSLFVFLISLLILG